MYNEKSVVVVVVVVSISFLERKEFSRKNFRKRNKKKERSFPLAKSRKREKSFIQSGGDWRKRKNETTHMVL